MIKKLFLLGMLFGALSVQAQDTTKVVKKSKKDALVTIKTEFGEMKLVLFDETPKHKENFLKLAKEGFYDGTTFHRIIKEFMIQGGDPNSKNDNPNDDGSGENGYRVDAEFNPNLFHRKGALAAARDNNPKKASSGCQFYIVHGKVFPKTELEQMQNSRMRNTKFTDEQMAVYSTVGGAPHLDMGYTVYGQLVEGFEVLDKIAEQPKNTRDRPEKDIKMTVTVKATPYKKTKAMLEAVYKLQTTPK